jgi:hypothetical protein
MPVDIFPDVNIPIIAVAWQYQGLSPNQMVGRSMTSFERTLIPATVLQHRPDIAAAANYRGAVITASSRSRTVSLR